MITKIFHDENTMNLKKNEADALKQLDHPHIIKLFDTKS